MTEKLKCAHPHCEDEIIEGWDCCKFHRDGGGFGNGEFYEQYQIIEQDFIRFIKYVPLDDKEHFKVYSPILRDILIRTCVQVELFFKEWGLINISYDKESPLLKTYRPNRSWTIKDYYVFKDDFFEFEEIFIPKLEYGIKPFDSWSSGSPPFWWKAYNSQKHGGKDAKKEANLKNVLYALAGLFELHCTNKFSNSFLSKFTPTRLEKSVDNIYIHFDEISTPLDTSRHLFKFGGTSRQKIEIVTNKELKKSINTRKRKGLFS